MHRIGVFQCFSKPSIFKSRWSRLLSSSPSSSSSASASSPTPLYAGSHSLQIRIMLSLGAINTFYWCGYVYDSLMAPVLTTPEGVISLSGDPRLGVAGAIGTLLIFYSTRTYATRACFAAWESADKQRLGFQLHSMLGGEGRKFEVPLRNAIAVNYAPSKKTSLMPVQIIGLSKNIVLDRTGTFYEDGKLLHILEANAAAKRNPTADAASFIDSKEKRIEWRQHVTRKGKQTV